jgi:hypothetical protein
MVNGLIKMPPLRPVVNGSHYTTLLLTFEGLYSVEFKEGIGRNIHPGDRLAELGYNPSSKGITRFQK